MRLRSLLSLLGGVLLLVGLLLRPVGRQLAGAPFTPGTPATPLTSSDPLAAFATWLRTPTSDRDPATGQQLALARRPVLKALIASDPRSALAHAVPTALRATLPPEILTHLETPITTAAARLEVTATCFATYPHSHHTTRRTLKLAGRTYAVHAYGRGLALPTQSDLPVAGIALDEALAIAEPLDTTHAEIAPAWTLGEKTVLWLRAEFSDDPGSPATDTAIQQTMSEVGTFFADVSSGRCTLRTVILPGVLRVATTRADTLNDPDAVGRVETEALALARAYDAANGNTGAYDPDRADRVIVMTKSVPGVRAAAYATVGEKGVFLNGSLTPAIIAHELGHNHGLHHAHGWRPTGSAPAGPGSHDEIGDPFDLMGFVAGSPLAHFNARYKADLHYLDADHIQNITTAGTYRLFRHDHRAASGVRALKLSVGAYEYWLEHRRLQPGIWFDQRSRFQSGLQIRWGRYPAGSAGTGTYLLDATPGTPAAFHDAPAMPGETVTDPINGVSFTPLATGGTAPNDWIDVRIDYASTPPPPPPTSEPARLINLSVRTRASSFTVGFVIAGSPAKRVLLRAAGPALTTLGVPEALANPRLDLFAGTTRLDGNDDWPATLAPAFQAAGAFAFSPGSRDAALLSELTPRAYTFQVTNATAASGLALAELYDLDAVSAASRLINVSAHGPVDPATPLIGGFVLRGTGTRTVLLRAIGPTLGAFGVPSPLAAPALTLYSDSRILATNTGWSTAANAAAIRTAATASGAFALPDTSRDSALLLPLSAGPYTLQITSPAAGTALLEIYEVP